jgi:hypothetical protein
LCSKECCEKAKEEKMRRRTPYWNFWRVILAGWIIRYPKTMGRIVLIPLGVFVVLIYNALVK